VRPEDERRREADRWIAWVRVAGVAFAAVEVGVLTESYPARYELAAWVTTAVFGVGGVVLLQLTRHAYVPTVGLAALVFDTLVVATYATLYSYEYGSPTRWALIFPVVEAALRYGLAGGVLLPLLLLPYLVFVEWWRAREFAPPEFVADRFTFPFGVLLITGLIVGWLVRRLARETELTQARALEAERLRDQLGRRVDLFEAANRCARALASSLEVERAFNAFIRELRGLIPSERTSIVMIEGGRAEVMAAAGRGSRSLFPPGTVRPVEGSVLEEVLEGKLVYRELIDPPQYPEEAELLKLALRCRVIAPLQVGPRTIGMLAIVRSEPRSFTPEEIELAALLGRLVATAAQNIRAYEAERRTVEELRRLSALRADFVSLVSHELRSPMAAVIGAARTLEGRWRELSADQREAFLALIGDETRRLADLISDVLDTSRIEAGTFSYTFRDVDVAKIVEEVVTAAGVGQDEVRVEADVAGALPSIRGDRERLRQVLQNLVDNAVKYSSTGGEVRVRARAVDGVVHVDVTDDGPGIPLQDQKLIFEKFGRSSAGGAKPGTGLGLFIARSIAEAHGGTLDVESALERGSTFTLALPADSRS
jgi:signal transduction histidine kinase